MAGRRASTACASLFLSGFEINHLKRKWSQSGFRAGQALNFDSNISPIAARWMREKSFNSWQNFGQCTKVGQKARMIHRTRLNQSSRENSLLIAKHSVGNKSLVGGTVHKIFMLCMFRCSDTILL